MKQQMKHEMKLEMKRFETLKVTRKNSLLKLALAASIALSCVFMSSTVFAKKVQYRKTQDVNFDGVDIDGIARNPDGAYLAQKRGIDFMPLYKVRKNFDDNIKESVEYVK